MTQSLNDDTQSGYDPQSDVSNLPSETAQGGLSGKSIPASETMQNQNFGTQAGSEPGEPAEETAANNLKQQQSNIGQGHALQPGQPGNERVMTDAEEAEQRQSA